MEHFAFATKKFFSAMCSCRMHLWTADFSKRPHITQKYSCNLLTSSVLHYNGTFLQKIVLIYLSDGGETLVLRSPAVALDRQGPARATAAMKVRFDHSMTYL